MWFLYVIGHTLSLALVNYIDGYLSTNNVFPKNSTIHTKIGGLLLISTLFTFIGGIVTFFIADSIKLSQRDLSLAILSGIPIVLMFGSYFYLLTIYPVYQVLPLFQLSSLWLLLLELISGSNISLVAFFGIGSLISGAYLLDAGTLKLKFPTKLLLFSIPSTFSWASALYLVRIASENSSPLAVSFWQMMSIGFIGVILFSISKQYRKGLLFRIKKQGKKFLGLSSINEGLSQLAYVFSNIAVSLAPIATYVTAMSGLQSVFLLTMFILFPIGEKTKISKYQILAIILIALGVYLIEK